MRRMNCIERNFGYIMDKRPVRSRGLKDKRPAALKDLITHGIAIGIKFQIAQQQISNSFLILNFYF